MLGLVLYWGEGTKWNKHSVALGNTDYKILLHFKQWLENYFGGEYESLKVHIQHHYTKKEDAKVIEHWSNQLGMPKGDFANCIHVKPRDRKKGVLRIGYGIATIVVGKGAWKIRQKIEKGIEELAAMV